MASMAAILRILPLMLRVGIGFVLCRLLGLAIVRRVVRPFDGLVAGRAGRRPAGRAFE